MGFTVGITVTPEPSYHPPQNAAGPGYASITTDTALPQRRADCRSTSKGKKGSTQPLTNTPGPPPRAATGPSAATARPSSSARGLIGCGSSQSAIRLRPPRERALSGRGAFNPSFRRERTAPPTRPPFSPPPSLFRRFAPRAPSRLPRAAPPPPAVPSQVCVLRHPPTRTGRAGVRRALRVTAAGLARGGRTVPLAASRGSRFRSPAPAPSAVGPAAFGAARAGQRGSRRRSVLGGAAWCARRIPPLA